MNIPPTAQGYDGPPTPEPGGNMALNLTTHGTIQLLFTTPINVVELNYYQALELAKGLRKGCKRLLRDGFAVQGSQPSDKFPWGRFGLTPDFPDTGEPPTEE